MTINKPSIKIKIYLIFLKNKICLKDTKQNKSQQKAQHIGK